MAHVWKQFLLPFWHQSESLNFKICWVTCPYVPKLQIRTLICEKLPFLSKTKQNPNKFQPFLDKNPLNSMSKFDEDFYNSNNRVRKMRISNF